MPGLMIDGSMAKGLMLNGRQVSAMINGVLVWPTASPIKQYERVRMIIGWNKSDNMGFDGMWLNGFRADFPDDCYAGQYYNGSWSPINSTEMSAICREGQGTAGTAFYCQSARFDFSGNQPSGWRNIAWTTQQYYQPTGTVTAEVWGKNGNLETLLGSGTYSIGPSATYTVNLEG